MQSSIDHTVNPVLIAQVNGDLGGCLTGGPDYLAKSWICDLSCGVLGRLAMSLRRLKMVEISGPQSAPARAIIVEPAVWVEMLMRDMES